MLRRRMILAFLGVTLSVLFLTNIVFSQILERQLGEYIGRNVRGQHQGIVETIGLAYAEVQSWQALRPFLNRMDWGGRVGLQIEDLQGRVVYRLDEAMGRGMMHRVQNLNWSEAIPYPIISNGTQVGTVYIAGYGPGHWTGEDFRFRETIMQAILWVGLVGLLLAGAVAFVVSRKVTKPLLEMTAVAHAYSQGHWEQRIPVHGQDELSQLSQTLNHMASRIQALMEWRERVTADIAHELRTPLSTLQGQLEAFMDGVVSVDSLALRRLHQEVLRLGILIKDLESLARLEARPPLHNEWIPFRVFLRDVLDPLRPRYAEKGIELKVEVEEGKVYGDQEALHRILSNLLINAWKYTDEGGVVLLRAKRDGHWTVFEVRDTGSGIAADHLDNIFERFYRVDPSRSRKTGGSGLGLAIVKELAEAHGGRVEVESELGVGSLFRVCIPDH